MSRKTNVPAAEKSSCGIAINVGDGDDAGQTAVNPQCKHTQDGLAPAQTLTPDQAAQIRKDVEPAGCGTGFDNAKGVDYG